MKRAEYPRPQFRRSEWISLNGEWQFEFDDLSDGEQRGLADGKIQLNGKIEVPFAYQYKASGIGDTSRHESVWYRRTFKIGKEQEGKSALLCFNGSDYVTDVWINGRHALTHIGGCAPFQCDITPYISAGENVIVVRCYDPDDPSVPRGKQSWTGKTFACWYVPTTGIWQSVWIEFFDGDGLKYFTIQPDIDTLSFSGEAVTFHGLADELLITVKYGGEEVKRARISLDGKHTRYSVSLKESDFVDESTYWTCENPNLYDVGLTLYRGERQIDCVNTRFGMRQIAIDEHGNIVLNHKKLYQRLILDQGYWASSGITPPSEAALKEDILAAQKSGFNGARKHQKFEDPYFYYYADEMGFLCWCEMPSAYDYCADEVQRINSEWQEIIASARMFTSIICYVPLNESWGVRKILTDENQQNFAASLCYLTKALDSTRLVSTNDGWENVSQTDIISVHDYAASGDGFPEKYRPENLDGVYPQGRKLMAYNHKSGGKPCLLTEFGGIALVNQTDKVNWGYGDGAEDAEEMYLRLQNLMDGVKKSDFQGFCYTQLTDVQQEVNGLLDADHKPKFDLSKLNEIFGR